LSTLSSCVRIAKIGTEYTFNKQTESSGCRRKFFQRTVQHFPSSRINQTLWRHSLEEVIMMFSDLDAAWPIRDVLWLVALLLAAFGVWGFYLKKSLRRKLVKFETRLRDELAGKNNKLASESNSNLAKVQTELNAVKSQANVFDLVPVLRFLNLLRSEQSALDALNVHPDIEHGHAVLMAVMTDMERAGPGSLAKKNLMEIGTTRERMVGQGSTEKLAIFTAFLGMSFVTVDMDPKNTRHAAAILPYLNPDAKAVTARGENYLKLEECAPDFVYLDAFDYDHGKHSEARQERYRNLLQTDINDEACWKMHEACAYAIKEKMHVGGVVVVDDTWTDIDGMYLGKGKLAVPLLLDSGFEIIAKTRMTIALRRKQIKNDVSAMEMESAGPTA